MCSCMHSKSSGWSRRNALCVLDLAKCYKMTQLYQNNLYLYKIVVVFISFTPSFKIKLLVKLHYKKPNKLKTLQGQTEDN